MDKTPIKHKPNDLTNHPPKSPKMASLNLSTMNAYMCHSQNMDMVYGHPFHNRNPEKMGI